MVGSASQSGERPAGGPALLGRYEVLTQLASGGMAHLYVGRRHGAQGFQRLVAIKRMRAHLLQNRSLTAQFADEARIASLIQHPNVVSIHDVHEEEGELFLVMDYIDGASLADLMKELSRRGQRVDVGVALRIVVDVLRGLHAAHELRDYAGTFMNVIHRDATPANVLLGRDGSVRITDFGVAKAIAREAQTQAGYIKGKLGYMAPEQATDQALDRRVDVFACGILLWELLAGRTLFAGSGVDVLRAVKSQPITPPSREGAKVTAAIDAAVMKALEREPSRRHATAAAFADALEEAARGEASGLATPTKVAEALGVYCLPTILERETRLKDVLSGRAPSARPEPPSQTTLPIVSDAPTTSDVSSMPKSAAPPPGPSPSATLPMHGLRDEQAIPKMSDVEVEFTQLTTKIMASPLAAAEANAAGARPGAAPPGAPPPPKAMATMLGMPTPGAASPYAQHAPPAASPGFAPAPPRAVVAADPFKAAESVEYEEPAFRPDPLQLQRTKRMRTIVVGVVGIATLLIVAAAAVSALRKPAGDDASGMTTTRAVTPSATAQTTPAGRAADPIPAPEPAPAAPTPPAVASSPVAAATPPSPSPTAPAPPPPTVAPPAAPVVLPPPPRGGGGNATPLPPPPPPQGKPRPKPGNIVRDAPF